MLAKNDDGQKKVDTSRQLAYNVNVKPARRRRTLEGIPISRPAPRATRPERLRG